MDDSSPPVLKRHALPFIGPSSSTVQIFHIRQNSSQKCVLEPAPHIFSIWSSDGRRPHMLSVSSRKR
ncbi:hypothetical protein CCHR01_14390 [Colletotrichum chrysophilum]|uniref:Uncharacterized protein n=1 Tax=Colletotrichum chrysophilum TaxID=1836956 RepID=A0AAD9E9M1_9PEZI|nr:hypothetical protein CCHR01_14390 [Colletotrichum chrysophilum]